MTTEKEYAKICNNSGCPAFVATKGNISYKTNEENETRCSFCGFELVENNDFEMVEKTKITVIE